MKKIYELGSVCDKQNKCKIGCKDCPFYKKEDKEDDFGTCKNKQSKLHEQEVYDHACCFYICSVMPY